jgi:molecular chaperone GrpE
MREQNGPVRPETGGRTATAPNGEAPEQTGVEGSEVSEVLDQLRQVTAERDEYLDQLQRSRAEFINFRRRTESERTLLRPLVTRDILAQFLPVVDDFQRALAAIPPAERESGWVKGVAMIETKLGGILERAGVTPVKALGQPFDPAQHEAVATEPGTDGSTVVEVYQPGYKVRDLLLRPAMVKTGAAPSKAETTTPDSGAAADGQARDESAAK